MKIKNTFIFLGLLFACFNTCWLKSAAAAAAAASEDVKLTPEEVAILVDFTDAYVAIVGKRIIQEAFLEALQQCKEADLDLKTTATAILNKKYNDRERCKMFLQNYQGRIPRNIETQLIIETFMRKLLTNDENAETETLALLIAMSNEIAKSK